MKYLCMVQLSVLAGRGGGPAVGRWERGIK